MNNKELDLFLEENIIYKIKYESTSASACSFLLIGSKDNFYIPYAKKKSHLTKGIDSFNKQTNGLRGEDKCDLYLINGEFYKIIAYNSTMKKWLPDVRVLAHNTKTKTIKTFFSYFNFDVVEMLCSDRDYDCPIKTKETRKNKIFLDYSTFKVKYENGDTEIGFDGVTTSRSVCNKILLDCYGTVTTKNGKVKPVFEILDEVTFLKINTETMR